MSRSIFILVTLFVSIMTFNSFAVAGVYLDAADGQVEDTLLGFSADLGWDEQAGSWNYAGTYWNANVAITNTGGTTWDVTWTFQHLTAPHPGEGETSPGPLFSQTASFDSLNSNSVVSESGLWQHTDGTDSEEWTFDVGLDPNTPRILENNDILLTVTHAPEPISSILFVTGGTILGFRRFRKR